MKTKEEILNNHPYLKIWIENPGDSEMQVCNIEQAFWAMDAYASEVTADLQKQIADLTNQLKEK